MTERSTQKQKALLDHVDAFIKEHGYGPSYREIMTALGYKSVSTVAIHIEGLITKGYLRKRDNSARSLEVVSAQYGTLNGSAATAAKTGGESSKEKWLVAEATKRFEAYEESGTPALLDELYVLVGSMKVLGFDRAYMAQRSRLAELLKR